MDTNSIVRNIIALFYWSALKPDWSTLLVYEELISDY